MPFAATWMDLEIIIVSDYVRERQIPYDITYMQNLKYDTNELIYETETEETHRYRQQTCVCQGVGGGVWEGWIGSLGLADANFYIQNG